MKFGGIYRGICTNASDPEGRLRIKVQVPQVLGKHETDWAWPCVPPGWPQHLLQDHDGGGHAQYSGSGVHSHPHTLRQRTPKPGQGVWIMFENGDPDHPVWLGVWS